MSLAWPFCAVYFEPQVLTCLAVERDNISIGVTSSACYQSVTTWALRTDAGNQSVLFFLKRPFLRISGT